MPLLHRLSYGSYVGDFVLPRLLQRLFVALRVPKTAAQPVVAAFEKSPEALPDIGTRQEHWSLGKAHPLTIQRESDWEWHDLRGIYLHNLRVRLEVRGLPEKEHLRVEQKHGELRVDFALANPLFGRVVKAMQALVLDGWEPGSRNWQTR